MQQTHLMSLKKMVQYYRKLHKQGVIEPGSAGFTRYKQLENKLNKRMRYR